MAATHPLPVAFTRAEAAARGGADWSLRTARRRGDLLRPLRGAYVDPSRAFAPPAFYRHRDADAITAAATAAAKVLPPDGALSDETAAFLLCGLGPKGTIPCAVVPAPMTRARRPDLRLRETDLPDDAITYVLDMPVTNGTRTALDLARRWDRTSALVAVDALLHTGTTTPQRLQSELARWAGHRGVLQARQLVAIADAGAASPGESVLRLAFIDAGLAVRTQVLLLGGRYVADLVVEDRVIVEFEGRHYDDPDFRSRDRRRFNAIGAIEHAAVRRYCWADLSRLGDVVADVRMALRSLRDAPPADFDP